MNCLKSQDFLFQTKKHTTTDSHIYSTPTNNSTPTNRPTFGHDDLCNDAHHPSLHSHRKYQEPHTQSVQRGHDWKAPCANCKRIHRAGNWLANFKVQDSSTLQTSSSISINRSGIRPSRYNIQQPKPTTSQNHFTNYIAQSSGCHEQNRCRSPCPASRYRN